MKAGRRCRFAPWLLLLVAASVVSPVSADLLLDAPFSIEYAAGDEATAQETRDILHRALEEWAARLPAGEDPIGVIICNTAWDFRRYAGAFGRPGVGGIARPEEGLIVLKAPRLMDQADAYEGTVRHELVHVLLARNLEEYNLPRWLNEGLAMTLAEEHRWNSTWRVAQMTLHGNLLPYRELEWALLEPGIEAQFGDAYAQSLSMTRYLFERFGEETVWALLGSMKTQTFGDALRSHAGMSPLEFYDAWRKSLWRLALGASIMSGFTLFQFMALLTIIAYLRKRHKGRIKLREWENEEACAAAVDSIFGHTAEEECEPWVEEDDDEESP